MAVATHDAGDGNDDGDPAEHWARCALDARVIAVQVLAVPA